MENKYQNCDKCLKGQEIKNRCINEYASAFDAVSETHYRFDKCLTNCNFNKGE